MRLLDLFAGAGGAGVGYHRAGFEVVGVEHKMGTGYPFECWWEDAMTVPLDGFDAIHASPPCGDYSITRNLHANSHPRLIWAVRERLLGAGVPYVIENVGGARFELRRPVLLCGSMFGLGVRRHRFFECNFPVAAAPPCAHWAQPEPLDVTGHGGVRRTPRPKGGGTSRKAVGGVGPASAAMGVDWPVAWKHLTQMVPPAYTQWIGAQLFEFLTCSAAASRRMAEIGSPSSSVTKHMAW